ncbi:MAG TPA: hypothetical protein VHA79_08485 [Mycobacteriales bacterium]|nr:hypothetical protein [Mycobacteriales bacterium]
MSIRELIETTWGTDAERDLSLRSRQDLERNVRMLWPTIKKFSGSGAPEPPSSVVHTARALPALLQHSGATQLVYDAGLGTLFSQTFKVLNDPQHEQVIDALLLRIAAVRRVCGGYLGTAVVLAAHADQILRVHRVRDYIEDAESAFETWVGVAMQEQFAVAHELLHYLEAADPASFDRLREQVLDRLRTASNLSETDPALASAHDIGRERPTTYGRHHAGVEPDSWWYAPRFDSQPELAAGKVVPVLPDLAAVAARDRRLLTELTCDVFAATACSIFAQRGNGWTPLQSAAASVLALATLGLVLSLDRQAAAAPAGQGDRTIDEWEFRQCGLRVLLAEAVGAEVADPAMAPTPAEVADVMRRAIGMYNGVIARRVALLNTWPANDERSAHPSPSRLLTGAGFLNLRADPRGQAQREREGWAR